MRRVAFVVPLGLILLGVGAPAKAQFVWGNTLQKSRESQQKQDSNDAMRAEAEPVQGQPVSSSNDSDVNTPSNSTTYVIPPGDALEGTNSPTYKLRNGSTITVSGGFRPDSQPPPPSTSGKGAQH